MAAARYRRWTLAELEAALAAVLASDEMHGAPEDAPIRGALEMLTQERDYAKRVLADQEKIRKAEAREARAQKARRCAT